MARAMQWVDGKAVDIFIVPPQEWAVALALRTGDRDLPSISVLRRQARRILRPTP